MLLAIDIGNSNIVIGVFEGEELKATWRVATAQHKMADEYSALILNLMPHKNVRPGDITEAIICSVVPSLVWTFEELCRSYFKVKPLIIEAGVKTGVRIAMDNPKEVGADRVVNAAAAHHLYGGPLIVIDFGTATTFDAVSEDGEYVGGAIAPGINISAEALFMRTAKLPQVELIAPKKAIGKNSITAIQSGIVFGYVGLIEGIVNRIKKELGSGTKVIATGGLIDTIIKETKVIDIIEKDLTLNGLRLINDLNKR
ncbi:MAG: type III pantothenate kinase [Dehalococcoidia bacterium]|nr:type III pantothenate kinase [Dehalococcoidia bacterium]MDZ4245883.1 type III pantothenate kinase [Dehalococcoidia bacterium]